MLLWCDGVDHYGVTETFMLDGPWSQLNNVELSTAVVRTGTHSMLSTGNVCFMRRQFGAPLTEAGVGLAIFLAALPNDNDRFCICEFRDAANAAQITVVVQTTGAIAVRRGGTGGTLLGTSVVLMTSGAWNQFEVYVDIDNSAGAVEVRMNGVTILNITGADTRETLLTETSQVVFGSLVATLLTFYLDDFFAWDTTGSHNNTFIGDHKVYLILPDANTADADWVPSTGVSGFAMIDEASPDDDSTYVEASVAGDMSQWGLGDLPSEVVGIAGVYVPGRSRKTDAGTCDVTQAMVSSASVASGASQALTTAYTYRPDVFEVDPATSALWTVSGFNAANLRYTRTA